jgi:hypothetical protein
MKKIATFVIAVFLLSLFFISAPERADAQPLCCQINADACFDSENPVPVECPSEDIIPGALCNFDTGQCQFVPSNVPTLSEWGLVAMAGVLGLVGFFVIRRRMKFSV